MTWPNSPQVRIDALQRLARAAVESIALRETLEQLLVKLNETDRDALAELLHATGMADHLNVIVEAEDALRDVDTSDLPSPEHDQPT